MFSSHLAIIHIERSDPGFEFDVEPAREKIRKKNAQLAQQIVLRSLLKAPKDANEKKRLQARLKKEAEVSERTKASKGFMEMWNRWREFYLDLDPLEPKTIGQLTAIENAIAFAKENDLDLNMHIACIHRRFSDQYFTKKKIRPNFTNLYDERAVETYEKTYELVLLDLDKEEYEDKASRRI